MHRHLALAAAVMLAAACNDSKATTPAPQQAAQAPAPQQAAQQAAAATLDRAAAQDPGAAGAVQTIAGQLHHEATHRPAGTTKAEDVLAALDKAGLPLADGPRQYLAKVVGAEFCMGGSTADGLAVSVCEYRSPDAATTGKAAVEKRFAELTPVRDIVVRGATTLTLTARPDAPLADRRRTAAEAFSNL